MYKRQVILSPYGDLIDFVKNQSGFFTVDYDKDSIINTLLRIKDSTYPELERMGKCNRQLAETISWKNRAKEIEYIYNKTKDNNETIKN